MTPEEQGYPGDWDDLDGMQDAYNEASEEYEGVPDGQYSVVVDHVEMKRSKKDGVPMVAWKFVIDDGEYEGQAIYMNNWLGRAESVGYLKRDLHTAGMTGLDTLQMRDLPVRIAELIGASLVVKVKRNGEYTNVYIQGRRDAAPDTGTTTPTAAKPPVPAARKRAF